MTPPVLANVTQGKADVLFDGEIVGEVTRVGQRWFAYWKDDSGELRVIKEKRVFPTEYRSRKRAVQAIEMKLRGGFTHNKRWIPLSESGYLFDSNS